MNLGSFPFPFSCLYVNPAAEDGVGVRPFFLFLFLFFFCSPPPSSSGRLEKMRKRRRSPPFPLSFFLLLFFFSKESEKRGKTACLPSPPSSPLSLFRRGPPLVEEEVDFMDRVRPSLPPSFFFFSVDVSQAGGDIVALFATVPFSFFSPLSFANLPSKDRDVREAKL